MMNPTRTPVVTAQEVEQVAKLARLELPAEELNRLAAQLDEILKYVQQLSQVSTDHVQPTSHVVPLTNIVRPDQAHSPGSPEAVLSIAPARHGQLFKVPKVIET